MEDWKEFKAKWADCQDCELCMNRRNICLYRGTLPCDLLIVGESPGEGEDVLGKPFKGPASIMFEKMIERKGLDKFNLGYTYLTACIAKNEDGTKRKAPKVVHINACRPRLDDLVQLCKPKVVLLLGGSNKAWEKAYGNSILTFRAMHPAAIMSMGSSVQNMVAVERMMATLEEIADTLRSKHAAKATD